MNIPEAKTKLMQANDFILNGQPQEALRLLDEYLNAYHAKKSSFDTEDVAYAFYLRSQISFSEILGGTTEPDRYYSKMIDIAASNEKNKREAFADINTAIALQDNIAIYYLWRGDLYVSVSEHKSARKDYERAALLAPNHFKVYSKMSALSRQEGNLKDALSDSNRSISLAPNDSFLYAKRAGIYYMLGQLERAFQNLRKALVLGNLPENGRIGY